LSAAESTALAAGVRTSLATLNDVAGIAGSFVCTQSGRLVAREIPALFEDAVLVEVGSRLLRVGEAFAARGDELEVAVIRYGEHRIYLKSIAGGMLCIVVAGQVNMPALRMAANLVGRRIAPAVARAEVELPPTPVERPPRSTGAGPPAATASKQEAPPGMRRFRGRTVD
jgi:predicted regulator of Ras-like GTPase activity (Roadblock/LC7/MglB family)